MDTFVASTAAAAAELLLSDFFEILIERLGDRLRLRGRIVPFDQFVQIPVVPLGGIRSDGVIVRVESGRTKPTPHIWNGGGENPGFHGKLHS